MPSDPLAPRGAQPGAGKGKRLHILIDFATSLEKRLSASSPASLVDDQLLEGLQTHVQRLHGYCQKPSHASSGNEDLDKLGTAIWNLSTRLMRDTDGGAASPDRRKLAVYARVFAFHLLDAAQHSAKVNIGNKIRLMRLALKAGKSSIEASELEMAGFVLQKGADYISRIGEQRGSLVGDDTKDVAGLEAEYYILRTALSWKEDRLDVAEHMYNKGHLSGRSLDAHYAEKLADVLYEIGRDMATKKDFQMAVKWLDRAQEIINGHDLEHLSHEGLDLRAAIMQAHITALINLETNEGFAKADNLVQFLQSEMGSTMVVLVLKLELLTKAPAEVFDSDAYATALSQMIKCFTQKSLNMELAGQSPGDPDFRLIVHHIGKLCDKSPTLGCSVLDEFIVALSTSPTDAWIERLVTKRVWMATHRGDRKESIDATESVLSHIKKPMSADATIAVQTLIWKTLASVYCRKLFDIAERWCKLALHRVFEASGPLNRAKIERKYLLCALARNDIDGARSIYHSMAEETQKEPRTLYLMYKIAIRSDDREAATTCIEGISRVPEPLEYLYACCLDAQEARHKEYAIEALSRLLEKTTPSASCPVHLPALLRCTIRLMVKNLDGQEDETARNEAIQKLCAVFDEGMSNVVANIERDPKDAKGNKLFDINELDWFARNTYNIGLKHLEAWDVSHTIRTLTTCNQIMSRFPPDISSDIAADIALKTLFNNFIVSSALLARARSRDTVEDRLQDYLLLRRHVAAFDAALPAQLPSLVEQARADMLSKLAALLAFDFEAALALKAWDDLCPIVRKAASSCERQPSAAIALQAMADCLLRSSGSSDPPAQTVYSALRAIIDALWALDRSLDAAKLARYMRCLFQATLPLDDGLALALAGEYVALLDEAGRKDVATLPEETEWLAATAFNHAVDCYFARRDGACKEWAARAFELAHLVPGDEGRLEAVLHERFSRLRFDVQQ